MNLINPSDSAPEADDRKADARASRAQGARRRAGGIPDAQQCLEALARLAGLVALGLVKPAQANAIRASFAEILRHHQRAQAPGPAAAVSDADLLQVLRAAPEVVNLLAPLLSEEQLAMVIQQQEIDDDV